MPTKGEEYTIIDQDFLDLIESAGKKHGSVAQFAKRYDLDVAKIYKIQKKKGKPVSVFTMDEIATSAGRPFFIHAYEWVSSPFAANKRAEELSIG